MESFCSRFVLSLTLTCNAVLVDIPGTPAFSFRKMRRSGSRERGNGKRLGEEEIRETVVCKNFIREDFFLKAKLFYFFFLSLMNSLLFIPKSEAKRS